MQFKYPHLHSYAKNENISMKEALIANNLDFYDLFQLPLSLVAHEELRSLREDINAIEQEDTHDVWILDSGPVFSAKKIYRSLIGIHPTHKKILDIWKSCNVPRQKFFIWLLMYNRLNTKEMMAHKNFYVEYKDCVLCDTCPTETLLHLFFE